MTDSARKDKGVEMGFFSIDGGFYRFISRFIDLVKLNLLWLLCSLPIVTIGASTVAAYSVALKMVDDEEGYIARSFFKAFRENLRQGIVLGIIFMAATYALYLDYELNRVSVEGSMPLMIIGILSAFIYVMAILYSFPLMARYENGIVATIQNSMEISRRYFGRTLFIVVLLALEFLVFNFNTILQYIGLLFGPAFAIFTVAAFSKRIFQEIEKDQRS
ncbi:MAG: YesL family protein [Roseburia sp.]|nr:YesL family protein [Roseburia sp.]